MPRIGVLFHYTNQEGLAGILGEQVLRASTTENNPADARHGDGKYLTDLQPGVVTPAKLSRRLVGHPFSGKRFTHYVAIDVKGLDVREVRANVFLIPGIGPLDLSNRIVDHGTWH
jgi:hypothetical protein